MAHSVPGAICIRPDASIECLHNDDLRLDELGTVTVKRASTIEFDDTVQKWVVQDAATGEELFTNVRRDACVAWEIAHFTAAFQEGHHPFG